jgi:hypothetical protein
MNHFYPTSNTLVNGIPAERITYNGQHSPNTTFIEINSLDRNISKYSNPAEYRFELPEHIKDVVHISLVGGTIPVNNYNIRTENGSFDVSYNSTVYTLTIPNGTYSATELASALQGQLQSNVDGGFSVSYSSSTDKMSFTHSSNDFDFLFTRDPRNVVVEPNSGAWINIRNPAPLLGFDANTDYSSTSSRLSAPYAVNLLPIERIYLYMNAEHSDSISNFKQGRKRKEVFGVIHLTSSDIEVLNDETTRFFSQTYGGQDLRHLDIEFRDQFGNLYDFQNKNHTLIFRIDVNTPHIDNNIERPLIPNAAAKPLNHPYQSSALHPNIYASFPGLNN